MTCRTHRAKRSGYALIVVLVFMLMFMAFVGVAFRRLGSALRVETTRTVQAKRDSGSLQALARGMALLETGLPPTNPYVCGTIVQTTAGPRSFTVTFVLEDGTTYTVHAAPTQAGDTPAVMPDTFFDSTP